jgi:hypothetical protein
MSTPWDELHRAYFNGEALWTYLTTPFLLALEGVVVEEAETLERGQRNVASASRAGGFNAAQLTSDYIVADGIHLPTRRRAYTRGPGRRPILDMLMVSIDISEVSFT